MLYFRSKSFLLPKNRVPTAEDIGSAYDCRANAQVKNEFCHVHALKAAGLCQHKFKN